MIKNLKQQGFTYLGVLVIMAVMLMAMGAVSEVWHTVMQREKERELIFIGHQFRLAISQYYQHFGHKYPPNLISLLEAEDAAGKKVHFLRKIYLDPVTGNDEWGTVIAKSGGVAGVYSLSLDKPYKQAGFRDADSSFELSEKYSDWKFVFIPAKILGQSNQDSNTKGFVRPLPKVK